MRKTLLITLEWPPQKGGIANYLKNIYNRLPRDKWILQFCPLESLPRFVWPRWLKILEQVFQLIKKERPETIHLSHILPIGYIALFFKKILHLPYLIYTHGMDILIPQKSAWKKWWLKRILNQAETIVANSQFTKAELQKLGLAPEKIVVIYPCPDIQGDAIANSQLLDKHNLTGKKIILSVGRLVARKGFDKVIEAMPKILEKIPNAIYCIIGDGPIKKELSNAISKLGFKDRIILTGEVGTEELAAFYSVCDIFVMPNREINGDIEGFGTVFLEAALFGKPSIAGQSGGAPEAILGGETGLLVNPQDQNEIADKIIELLKNDELRIRLGKKARERALKEFNWDIQVQRLLSLLG